MSASSQKETCAITNYKQTSTKISRAGVRPHSAKRSLAGLLIAKLARRRAEIAMQTAGSGPDSPSTAIFTTLPVTASGHPVVDAEHPGGAGRG